MVAQQQPFPWMPPVSTETLLQSFDEYAYLGTPSTVLYKYLDALVGTTGAGSLLNQLMLTRMGASLQTIYFNDLDYIFGSVGGLARSPAESYDYNPHTDLLTADQWSEVRIKDAWYRARVVDFFKACALGGTPDGIRMAIKAAVDADCDIYETWRYIDDFGITESLGRVPTMIAWSALDMTTGTVEMFETEEDAQTFVSAQSPVLWAVQKIASRNEVVVRPHKTSLAPEELRLCRDMLAKIMPVDAIMTVNLTGLGVRSPVTVNAATADSSYFEVQRVVTATPVLSQLPDASQLSVNLLASETWLFDAQTTPTVAPTAAFCSCAEYGYYYLVSGGKRSPIDSVTYGTLNKDGSVKPAVNFQQFDTTGQYTAKQPYQIVDSPDNYPGGKFGIHPATAPALNPDGSPYTFKYTSEEAYIAEFALQVISMGGIADADGYSMPVQAVSSSAQVFYPEYAISSFPPGKASDVSSSLTRSRAQRPSSAIQNTRNFTRS